MLHMCADFSLTSLETTEQPPRPPFCLVVDLKKNTQPKKKRGPHGTGCLCPFVTGLPSLGQRDPSGQNVKTVRPSNRRHLYKATWKISFPLV